MILKYTLIVLLAITLPSSIETIEPKNDNSQTMSFPKLSSLSNLLKTSGSGTQPGFTITENDIPQDVRDAWNDIHHWLSTPASEIDQAIQHVLAYIPFFQDKLKSLQEKNNQILSKIDIFLKNFRNIKLPDININ
ncbi:MAG TPA: hypothetical protein VHA52_09705, partial [Candidatus Babeliaceae bacterium]|nr:hypothetical protein [Candidatus Babeliaceae bacterium]